MALGTLKRRRAKFTGKGFHLRVGFAAGAGASTNITITGIRPGDELVSVLNLKAENATTNGTVISEQVANTTITAADTIQCTNATNSPTNSQVLVIWWSKD